MPISAELRQWPKISIVTPSFNQGAFLEQTIRSVLLQGYPNLQYIVIDGGSTDDSLDIIRKYAPWLDFWVSEPDRGQAHAINKGLRRASGDWVAWQNSDDIFYPGAFQSVARAALANPHVDLLIGDMMLIDEEDNEIRDIRYVRPTYRALLAEGMVLTNQAAFWRSAVHAEIGYLDESLDYGFDYEWFLRLLRRHKGEHVNRVWGGLRVHGGTKTSRMQHKFEEEYRAILKGRAVSWWEKRVYQLRRLALTLANGNIRYVTRGTFRRFACAACRLIGARPGVRAGGSSGVNERR